MDEDEVPVTAMTPSSSYHSSNERSVETPENKFEEPNRLNTSNLNM
jgi:hypothetical protein